MDGLIAATIVRSSRGGIAEFFGRHYQTQAEFRVANYGFSFISALFGGGGIADECGTALWVRRAAIVSASVVPCVVFGDVNLGHELRVDIGRPQPLVLLFFNERWARHYLAELTPTRPNP